MNCALRRLQQRQFGELTRRQSGRPLAVPATFPSIAHSNPWRGLPHVAHPRYFSVSRIRWNVGASSNADKASEKAKQLNQKGLEDQEDEVLKHQVARPWHRVDADKAPAERKRTARGSPDGSLPKGKLLTTPTRLLKLVLPLPLRVERDTDNNGRDYARALSSNDDIQPLALLVHPQQPLSYLERLIQAELPYVNEDGRDKIPNVYFRAEDAESASSKKKKEEDQHGGHVASYSGLGHEGPERENEHRKWVRWSSSTEVGDFIRDAARGREFAVEIEGHGIEMRVGVPSFKDRTYYLRLRLRKMSQEIDQLADIKRECDLLAHKGAHRIAKGGFGALMGWWGVVYYTSFHTQWGWDLVEPITYLAGLTTIMGGYLWFLYISRDLSYKAAMNVTVSRRQNALYEARGFNLHRWEQLVHEANALRKEIRAVATEYDVDWDEMRDLGGEEVKKVLEHEKAREKANKGADEDDSSETEPKQDSKGDEGEKSGDKK